MRYPYWVAVGLTIGVVVLEGCGGHVGRTVGSRAPATNGTATETTNRTATETARKSVAETSAQPATTPAAPVHRPRSPARIRRRATGYRFSSAGISPALRAQMTRTSWHPGCPVALAQLRYLRVGYWGFDHRPHLGEMVVNAGAVSAMRTAFASLFRARFPIRRMRLVDRYGGSDYESIQADNTSAFNCRDATGGSRWSEHAYGLALDIDPIENPYVYADGTTSHPASRPYLDRRDVRPGMAEHGGSAVHAFSAVGWGWGGRWPLPTDFQHFSANGR